MRAVCRSCQAPVVWAVTESGKRIPLDERPTAAGNLAIVRSLDDGTPVVTFQRLAIAGPVARYVAHFVTCPQAHEWRRR